jgi:hypothetical protein
MQQVNRSLHHKANSGFVALRDDEMGLRLAGIGWVYLDALDLLSIVYFFKGLRELTFFDSASLRSRWLASHS